MRKIIPDRFSSPVLGAWPRGFSLVEVVVALGIFTVAVFMTIAMMTNSLQSETAVVDRNTANRLAGAINAKLASLGYDVVQGTTDTNEKLPWVPATGLLFDANQDPNSSGIDTTSAGSKVLYVSKTADKVGTFTDPIWGGSSPASNALKYYEAMLVRVPNQSQSPPADPSSPSASTLTASSVLFTVRISWPAYMADGTPADSSARSTRNALIFNAALAR